MHAPLTPEQEEEVKWGIAMMEARLYGRWGYEYNMGQMYLGNTEEEIYQNVLFNADQRDGHIPSRWQRVFLNSPDGRREHLCFGTDYLLRVHYTTVTSCVVPITVRNPHYESPAAREANRPWWKRWFGIAA